MRPLSILNYYRNNIKKLSIVFIAVSLSVFLVYMLQMLINSSFYTEHMAFVEPQKYYTSFLRDEDYLTPELIEAVKNHESAAEIMPWVFYYTNIDYTFGDTGTKILSLYEADMKKFMQAAGLRLSEGRYPAPRTEEILLHRLVAKNKGLETGDRIGSLVDNKEVFPGEHEIVGIVDGDPVISFVSLETWEATYDQDPYMYGMIVLPVKGELEELNKYVEALPYQGLEIRTLASVAGESRESRKNVEVLLTIVNFIVITIVSLCAGFLCYIYFLQRRAEFGVLNAIGYTRQHIINRAFAEVSGINAAAFVSGILLALLCSVVLNRCVYMPRGQLLVVWDISYIIRVLCIPLFVSLFSVIPIWRMLIKLDPIAIIEGEA